MPKNYSHDLLETLPGEQYDLVSGKLHADESLLAPQVQLVSPTAPEQRLPGTQDSDLVVSRGALDFFLRAEEDCHSLV